MIALNFGLVSRKHISFDGEIFYVHNYIDESKQELTESGFMDKSLTHIGHAMEVGALAIYTSDLGDPKDKL